MNEYLPFTITRRIEIDAGHRVCTHGSKCKNKHGHRYKIDVTAAAKDLQKTGTETGMVCDFGRLKGMLETIIHHTCDHAFIVWAEDKELLEQFFHGNESRMREAVHQAQIEGGYSTTDSIGDKLFILYTNPTAENLAEYWFYKLFNWTHSADMPFTITKLTVWETPNCYATYGGE